MRKTLMALLGCALLAVVFAPMAIGAEAEPTLIETDQRVVSADPLEPSANLLAVQGLEVTPMTDTELDQIVGASPIIVAIEAPAIELFPGFSIGLDGLFSLDLGNGEFNFAIESIVGLVGSLDLF